MTTPTEAQAAWDQGPQCARCNAPLRAAGGLYLPDGTALCDRCQPTAHLHFDTTFLELLSSGGRLGAALRLLGHVLMWSALALAVIVSYRVWGDGEAMLQWGIGAYIGLAALLILGVVFYFVGQFAQPLARTLARLACSVEILAAQTVPRSSVRPARQSPGPPPRPAQGGK